MDAPATVQYRDLMSVIVNHANDKSVSEVRRGRFIASEGLLKNTTLIGIWYRNIFAASVTPMVAAA